MQVNTLLFVILDVCCKKMFLKINSIFLVRRRPMDSVGFSHVFFFFVSVLGIKAIWSLQPCRKCDSHHNNLIFVYIYI